MKRLVYILLVVLVLPFFVGCEKSNQVQTGNDTNGEFIACTAEEKAAENCNMINYPVCGDDGETYGNTCVACSSKKINSYKMGECDCDAENGICSVGNLVDENVEEEIPETIIEVPLPNF